MPPVPISLRGISVALSYVDGHHLARVQISSLSFKTLSESTAVTFSGTLSAGNGEDLAICLGSIADRYLTSVGLPGEDSESFEMEGALKWAAVKNIQAKISTRMLGSGVAYRHIVDLDKLLHIPRRDPDGEPTDIRIFRSSSYDKTSLQFLAPSFGVIRRRNWTSMLPVRLLNAWNFPASPKFGSFKTHLNL